MQEPKPSSRRFRRDSLGFTAWGSGSRGIGFPDFLQSHHIDPRVVVFTTLEDNTTTTRLLTVRISMVVLVLSRSVLGNRHVPIATLLIHLRFCYGLGFMVSNMVLL